MRLQELEPVSAKLALNVEKDCRQRLPFLKGKKLLIALSGGADSVALALILQTLAPRMGLDLAAAHINHGLRAEADADADFVARFCEKCGLECAICKTDVRARAERRKCGIEEAGREARLEILEKERLWRNADFIAVAHHAGDLAEDILMRLARGAGWPAAGGMAWQSGNIVRPLLHTPAAALRGFLLACGQNWREDKSNRSLAFMRNRMRHVVLPLLRCENSALDEGLLRFHDLAALDAAFWQDHLDCALAQTPWQLEENEESVQLLLPRALLAALHPAARLRLYHRALQKLRASSHKPGQTRHDTLQRLEQVFCSGIGGKLIQCSGGITAHCGKAGILLRKGQLE